MVLNRIRAIIERHLWITFRDLMRLSDFFYFPLIDILIWGFTSKAMQTNISNSNVNMLIMLTSLVLLQISHRGNNEVTFSLLDEIWSHNLVNIFATPLKLNEWITSVIFLGILKAIATALFGALIVYFFYHINIFQIGLFIIPCAILLLISGWAIGFFSSSLVLRKGQRAASLTWLIVWSLAPFSAVFYPLSVLPNWGQFIAKTLPMSYVFESLRIYITTQTIAWHALTICALLNLVYFIASLTFFKYMFKQSLNSGLSQLENN